MSTACKKVVLEGPDFQLQQKGQGALIYFIPSPSAAQAVLVPRMRCRSKDQT